VTPEQQQAVRLIGKISNGFQFPDEALETIIGYLETIVCFLEGKGDVWALAYIPLTHELRNFQRMQQERQRECN